MRLTLIKTHLMWARACLNQGNTTRCREILNDVKAQLIEFEVTRTMDIYLDLRDYFQEAS